MQPSTKLPPLHPTVLGPLLSALAFATGAHVGMTASTSWPRLALAALLAGGLRLGLKLVLRRAGRGRNPRAAQWGGHAGASSAYARRPTSWPSVRWLGLRLAGLLAWALLGGARGRYWAAELHVAPGATRGQVLAYGVLAEPAEPGDLHERWLVRLSWCVTSQGGWHELEAGALGLVQVEVRQGGKRKMMQPCLAHWRQRVCVVGTLIPVDALVSSDPRGRAGFVAALHRRGVRWRIEVADPQHVAVLAASPPAEGGSYALLQDRLAAARLAFEEQAQAGVGEPAAALLRGIVLGDGHALGDAEAADFRATGTYHVVAASGLNVSILAGLSERLSEATRLPGTAGCALTLVIVCLYTVVAGGAPSLVRAAIMGGLSQLAFVLGRRTAVESSLGVAILAMVAVSPSIAEDLGFELSVASVLGIRVLTPRLESLMRRLPRPLASALAVTLAAQLATLPLMTTSFGQLSLIAPLANLVIVPPTELALVTGLVWWATLAVCQVPLVAWLGQGLSLVLCMWHRGLLALVLGCAHRLGQVPGASVQLATPPTWYAPAWYLGLICWSLDTPAREAWLGAWRDEE
jgi:ComEC/Rec2-related protein